MSNKYIFLDNLSAKYGKDRAWLATHLGITKKQLELTLSDNETTIRKIQGMFACAGVSMQITVEGEPAPKPPVKRLSFLKEYLENHRLPKNTSLNITPETWENDDLTFTRLWDIEKTLHIHLVYNFEGLGYEKDSVINKKMSFDDVSELNKDSMRIHDSVGYVVDRLYKDDEQTEPQPEPKNGKPEDQKKEPFVAAQENVTGETPADKTQIGKTTEKEDDSTKTSVHAIEIELGQLQHLIEVAHENGFNPMLMISNVLSNTEKLRKIKIPNGYPVKNPVFKTRWINMQEDKFREFKGAILYRGVTKRSLVYYSIEEFLNNYKKAEPAPVAPPEAQKPVFRHATKDEVMEAWKKLQLDGEFALKTRLLEWLKKNETCIQIQGDAEGLNYVIQCFTHVYAHKDWIETHIAEKITRKLKTMLGVESIKLFVSLKEPEIPVTTQAEPEASEDSTPVAKTTQAPEKNPAEQKDTPKEEIAENTPETASEPENLENGKTSPAEEKAPVKEEPARQEENTKEMNTAPEAEPAEEIPTATNETLSTVTEGENYNTSGNRLLQFFKNSGMEKSLLETYDAVLRDENICDLKYGSDTILALMPLNSTEHAPYIEISNMLKAAERDGKRFEATVEPDYKTKAVIHANSILCMQYEIMTETVIYLDEAQCDDKTLAVDEPMQTADGRKVLSILLKINDNGLSLNCVVEDKVFLGKKKHTVKVHPEDFSVNDWYRIAALAKNLYNKYLGVEVNRQISTNDDQVKKALTQMKSDEDALTISRRVYKETLSNAVGDLLSLSEAERILENFPYKDMKKVYSNWDRTQNASGMNVSQLENYYNFLVKQLQTLPGVKRNN